MEIARSAAGLFVSRGLRATRAEDIAQAAGVAPRTFYRYFATKEEAIAPLYAAGAQRWAEAVRAAPPHLSLPEALEYAVRQTLTPGVGVSAASWEWVRTLIRLASTSPALGKVWAEVCHATEGALGEVLRRRAEAGDGMFDNVADHPGSGEGVRGAEGTQLTEGTRPAPGARSGERTESGEHARPESGEHTHLVERGDPTERTRPTERAGFTDRTPPTERAESAVPTPRQRFLAAVASAAVRVAVESWATTNDPPNGPRGPAELALRNLEAVRGMEWGSASSASG